MISDRDEDRREIDDLEVKDIRVIDYASRITVTRSIRKTQNDR